MLSKFKLRYKGDEQSLIVYDLLFIIAICMKHFFVIVPLAELETATNGHYYITLLWLHLKAHRQAIWI